MGMVGSTEMVTNFTALGDDINVGARIASATGPGELLASLDLCQQAGIDEDGPEKRRINLKGKQEPMDVAVVPVN
jgi:class 3 adenylate cyclase